MKTVIFLVFTTLCCTSSFLAQIKRGSYTQFNLSVPLRGNLDSENESDYWFLPDGLSVKFGGGMHYNKTISIGINTGVDWIGSKKLVIVPVFGNLKLSTSIEPETLLYLQAGYGESIFIGRGGITGDYKKIGIGIDDKKEGIGIFAEYAQYGITLFAPEKVWSISLGISFTSFKNRNSHPNPTSSP